MPIKTHLLHIRRSYRSTNFDCPGLISFDFCLTTLLVLLWKMISQRALLALGLLLGSVNSFVFLRPSFDLAVVGSQQQEYSVPPVVMGKTSCLFGKKDARAEGNERKNKTERVRKPKDDVIEVEGVVLESLPNAMFRCAIDGAPDTQQPILATISGKIRKNFVKILVGDKVLIELSPYDLTRGRITFRYR